MPRSKCGTPSVSASSADRGPIRRIAKLAKPLPVANTSWSAQAVTSTIAATAQSTATIAVSPYVRNAHTTRQTAPPATAASATIASYGAITWTPVENAVPQKLAVAVKHNVTAASTTAAPTLCDAQDVPPGQASPRSCARTVLRNATPADRPFAVHTRSPATIAGTRFARTTFPPTVCTARPA